MTDAAYLAHLTHGCRATKLVLYEGEEAEFAEFTEAWRAEYPPNSPLEERLLSEVIQKAWQERRCDLRYLEVDVLQGVKKPSDWSADEQGDYDNYITALSINIFDVGTQHSYLQSIGLLERDDTV